MISLNYRDSRPIYEQIKENFKRLIVTGAMGPDEKLPSVRTLATQLSINPNTIQRAYNELEREGYCYSVPGKGSFVTPSADAGEKRRRELRERFQALAAELLYLGVARETLETWIQEADRDGNADRNGKTVPAERKGADASTGEKTTGEKKMGEKRSKEERT